MAVELLTEADVYDAVIAFLEQYALPAVDDGNIFRGWQNRSALPAGTNEYIIVSVMSGYRRGTNVRNHLYDGDGEASVRIAELVEADVQIDFCSDDETAMRRAQAAETVGRDPLGVQFFRALGIGCLYVSDIQEASFVGDANNFVRRYILTFRVSYWTGVQAGQQMAENAAFERVENVDAHHKP